MKKTKLNADKLEALKQLKKYMKLTKNNRVYARVVSVSRSGMSRVITFHATTKKGDMIQLNGLINRITGDSWSGYDGIRVYGCGMDMIFNTLYVINGYAINYGVVRVSKNKTLRDLHYNGLVDTNYWSF